MSETVPPTTTEPRRRLRAAAPALAAALLALALYAVTLGGTYVYDDTFIARDDDRLRDPAQWSRYWTSDYFDGGLDRLFRPLVSMSYAVQWWLHGNKPWAFHAVNWVLHAGVSALVAELARRLAGTKAAYVAGLLFAAHPVHVEAVANIVGRSELMCAAASVGALAILAGGRLTTRRVLAIWGCLVLALLSKEQGMLLPLLLLLLSVALHWTSRQRPGFEPAPKSEHGRWLLFAVVATLAVYVIYREQTIRFWWDRERLDWVMNPLVRSRGADRWLMPLVLLGRYTALLVAPWRLSVDYGATVIGWEARAGDPYLWAGAGALLLWAVLMAVAAARRAWAAAFCLLAVAVTYGLVGNVATLIGTIFNERLLYLPSAFFLILAGIGAARLPARSGPALAAAMAVVLALGSVRTFTYARRWNDPVGFYEAGKLEQPRSIQIYLLLAGEYRERGRPEEAERVLAEARRLTPDYWVVYNFSAHLAMTRGDLDLAERYVIQSMQLLPNPQGRAILGEIQKRRATAATQPSVVPVSMPSQGAAGGPR